MQVSTSRSTSSSPHCLFSLSALPLVVVVVVVVVVLLLLLLLLLLVVHLTLLLAMVLVPLSPSPPMQTDTFAPFWRREGSVAALPGPFLGPATVGRR